MISLICGTHAHAFSRAFRPLGGIVVHLNYVRVLACKANCGICVVRTSYVLRLCATGAKNHDARGAGVSVRVELELTALLTG